MTITSEQANAFIEKATAQKRIDISDLDMFVPDGGCVCLCYDIAEIWGSREAAETSFIMGLLNSEGAESDRYLNVITDIQEGKSVCLDGVSRYAVRIDRRFR